MTLVLRYYLNNVGSKQSLEPTSHYLLVAYVGSKQSLEPTNHLLVSIKYKLSLLYHLLYRKEYLDPLS